MDFGRDDYNERFDQCPDFCSSSEFEPVFLLRARDEAAPAVVDMWAAINEMIGGDKALSIMARQQAGRMRQWQIDNGKHKADLTKKEKKL